MGVVQKKPKEDLYSFTGKPGLAAVYEQTIQSFTVPTYELLRNVSHWSMELIARKGLHPL